jgi:5'-nucleotidase
LRILITNDDGINASGLKVLEKIARKISSDIWVAAPETEQSGAGHSLSLHRPLRVRRISSRKFAVDGTPTDCVLLAKSALLPKRTSIDLVLSGVNRGSNVGEDVTYSGTIAAAMEATLLGIRSIALSQAITDGKPIHWSTAENRAPDIIKKLLTKGWPKGSLINMNFPDCVDSEIKGTKVVHQGIREIGEKVSKRQDPRGRDYYWIGGPHLDNVGQPGSDIEALDGGYITITPITLDLTDYKTMRALSDL